MDIEAPLQLRYCSYSVYWLRQEAQWNYYGFTAFKLVWRQKLENIYKSTRSQRKVVVKNILPTVSFKTGILNFCLKLMKIS